MIKAMSKPKNMKKGGLGRSLTELLSDNDEAANLENKVLMHKDDGSTVQIYAKSDRSEDERRAYGQSIAYHERAGKSISVGKTRQERSDEADGILRRGKSHVKAEGASPIKINPAVPKREPEAPRMEIGRGKGTNATTAEGLEQLDRYRPTVKDSFLEELLEVSETTPSKSYERDRDGRIIINSSKSKVKKR